MKLAEPTTLHRKSGMWGTVDLLQLELKTLVGLRPISANVFRMFFVKVPTKSSILSGAPHRFIV
jgi:hypothetical protein